MNPEAIIVSIDILAGIIRDMPSEDRKDIFLLIEILADAENSEGREAAWGAIREIIENPDEGITRII